MTILRDTLLIVEKGDSLAGSLQGKLREKGYFCIRIERPEDMTFLLDFRDIFRSCVFVDDGYGVFEECFVNLKLLKAMSHPTPLVFCTAANSFQKEQRVRDLGVFYYHTVEMGLDHLLTAILCALKKSVLDEIFLSRSHYGIGRRQMDYSC